MQKARRHPQKGAPTACRRTVSGSLSLPCSGFFSPFPHGTGSLSVSCECLAFPDGPGGFTQDYSCPALLRVPLRRRGLRVRASHPLRGRFPAPSPRLPPCDDAALQPRGRLDAPGLGSSLFARRYWGNHCYFLFLRVLRCFSSPRSPPAKRDATLRVAGCPIRVPADQRPLAPPRGFSQLAAPFVACKSLGIHRAPLSTSSDARAFQPATCRHGVRSRLHTSVVPFAWAFLILAFLSSTSCLSQHVKDLAALVRAGVENDGFEPSTPCLQGRCSSQLS